MSSRSNRKVIAENTAKILDRGFYNAGQRIELAELLQRAISGTRLYRPEDLDTLEAEPESQDSSPQIDVVNQTTFSGCRELLDSGAEAVCCLNFASAKNPGGGFLNGSQAQEEALARASGLYACLTSAPEYYEVNRRCRTALYTHHLIYSPGVPVFRNDSDELLEEPWLTSIITAPAPNAGAVRQNAPGEESMIVPILEERVLRVLEIARLHGERALVLGAWGCGVFQNDPSTVAAVFQKQLNQPRFANAFDRIRFSVLDFRNDGTLDSFEAVFSEKS